MSTILPPGAQTPPPQSATTAQAAPTAVVREPTVELLRVAAGTRIEGTVVPQAPTPQPSPPLQQADAARLEAARTAAQTLQTAADAARTDTARADTRSAPPPQTSPSQAPPQVTVRTPVGDVTLRTPLPIPDGARVAFDIASTNANQVTVRLTTLNGQPIQQALVQLAADRAPPPPSGTPLPAPTSPLGQAGPTPLSFAQMWTPGGPIALTQAGPLNAFVLTGTSPGAVAGQATGQIAAPQTPGTLAVQGAGGQTQSPAGQSPLFTGSDLTIRITAVGTSQPGQTGTIPGVQTSPAASPNVTGQTVPGMQPNAAPQTSQAPGTTVQGTAARGVTAQGAPQTSPQSLQGPGSLLPAGGNSQSGLRLVGAQGWPQPPLATPGNVQSTPIRLALTGIVIAQSTAGQTVIQTDAGTLQLANRVNLPPGTNVTLDVLAQAAPRSDATGTPLAASAPPVATAALPFATGATPWPALTEALQVLQRSDPQAAQLLSNALPDGGPRTVVAALSFIQAMRTGDPRQWPGDNNLRALERAGPRGAHLARMVSGEVAQLSAQSREATGEWRSTPIPWNADGQIEKINLITRREDPPDDEEEDETSANKAGLRFLLDLELTNLGAVQLDGMVKEESKGFDLMIRSHESLDDPIRRDLTGLFIATNQAVGLKGQLTFQVTQKFADPIGSNGPLKLERDGVWA